MRPDSGAVCDVFITLVHGTWPRNVLRDVFLTPFYGRWPGGFVPKCFGSRPAANPGTGLLPRFTSVDFPSGYRPSYGRARTLYGSETELRTNWLNTYGLSSPTIPVLPKS